MARVILILLVLFFFIFVIYFFIHKIMTDKEESEKFESGYLSQEGGLLKLKKTSIDYWYEKPHYYILPCGKQINLSEYLTYEEYKELRGAPSKWARWINNMNSNFTKENTETIL